MFFMGRLARIVLPGVVHHVTQRGVRAMDLFHSDSNRRKYLDLLKEYGERSELKYIGYCLMTNHVHLLVIPLTADSMKKGIGEAHQQYSSYINFKAGARGHLFQERFFSCPMDHSHFLAAARYVERNPVRAGLVKEAEQYRWSSARYHLELIDEDPLLKAKYKGIGSKEEWFDWLRSDPADLDLLRKHFKVGRPLGGEAFLKKAEEVTGRELIRKKGGRPRK
jgi:putative transposase